MILEGVQAPYALHDVTVLSAELVTPHLKRLTIDGAHVPGLKRDLPGQWLKVFVQDEEGRRLPGRAYTVRRLHGDGRIDIDFVLHGDEGRISAWAARVSVGDPFEVSAPHSRSGFAIDGEATHYLLAADETGFPAVAAILEALPADATATVLVEVVDASEQQPVSTHARLAFRWLARGPGQPTLADAVRALEVPTDTAAFVAAESRQVGEIRSWLKARGTTARLDASGYWKRGEADHRDAGG
jgi:NADPH-dependent ferric siderophore reductase